MQTGDYAEKFKTNAGDNPQTIIEARQTYYSNLNKFVTNVNQFG